MSKAILVQIRNVVEKLKEGFVGLKGKNFDIALNVATAGQFQIFDKNYKEKLERIHVFFDSSKIIIRIGDDKYALIEKQLNAIREKHKNFFYRNSCGGAETSIPVNLKEHPDIKKITNKIASAYLIAVTAE